MRPDEVATWEDVREVARDILQVDADAGVQLVHVTAVWQDEDTGYRTLNIIPETPTSDHDRFVLSLARARADAIVTTGKILRSEPELSHEFLGPPALRRAFADWRKVVLAKQHPPLSVVLTSGRTLDCHHSIFQGPTRPLIFTSTDGKSRLASWAEANQVEVVGVDHPSAGEAVAHLQDERGAGTVSLEAGPSTTLPMYHDGPTRPIDELLLSVYLGPRISGSVRGARFLDREALERAFPFRSEPYVVEEPSGPWQFQRFTRQASK
jgi:riboflavin biosynthesis pyrimidine reductase